MIVHTNFGHFLTPRKSRKKQGSMDVGGVRVEQLKDFFDPFQGLDQSPLFFFSNTHHTCIT